MNYELTLTTITNTITMSYGHDNDNDGGANIAAAAMGSTALTSLTALAATLNNVDTTSVIGRRACRCSHLSATTRAPGRLGGSAPRSRRAAGGRSIR